MGNAKRRPKVSSPLSGFKESTNKPPVPVIDLSSDSEDEIIALAQKSDSTPQNANQIFSNLATSTYISDLAQSSSRDLTPTTDSGFVSDPARDIDDTEDAQPGPVDAEKEIYEVEKIITSNKGKYLLKWKGWSYLDSTWEAEDNLNCQDVLKKYKIRLRIVEKIKDGCSASQSGQYPYNKQYYVENIPRLFLIHQWEDHLNKICRESIVAPIFIENWCDEELAPADFVFGQENVFHWSAKQQLEPLYLPIKCKCGYNSYCKRGECCSNSIGLRFPYKGSKLDNDQERIIECSDECACDRNCPGRLVQRRRQIPIVLFRTVDRGWSIKAASYIQQGTFVMTYCGEVISRDEIARRGDLTSFMFDVDCEHVDKHVFTVDSLNYGNEARWINHSCDPNLKTFGILIDRYKNYETLAFFAIKDIKVGDELSFDYYSHISSNEALVDGLRCLCGAKKCRGYLMD